MRIITLKDVGTVTSDIADGIYQGVAISAWSVTGDYAVGDIKYYSATRPNYVYKCKTAIVHTGSDPIPSLDTARWTLIGTTDRDAEFDDLIGTQSMRMASHTVTVDSSSTDYAVLYNLEATSITLTLTVAGSTIKTEKVDLSIPVSNGDWWTYFYESQTVRPQFVWEYPLYAASTLTVTITAYTGAYAKCGVFRWGKASGKLAGVKKGMTSSLIDYSTKGTVYAINQGPSADNIDLTMTLTRGTVDVVRQLFRSNTGRVAVYDCNDDDDVLDSLIILAIYRAFTRVFEYKELIKCSVSLLGVI